MKNILVAVTLAALSASAIASPVSKDELASYDDTPIVTPDPNPAPETTQPTDTQKEPESTAPSDRWGHIDREPNTRGVVNKEIITELRKTNTNVSDLQSNNAELWKDKASQVALDNEAAARVKGHEEQQASIDELWKDKASINSLDNEAAQREDGDKRNAQDIAKVQSTVTTVQKSAYHAQSTADKGVKDAAAAQRSADKNAANVVGLNSKVDNLNVYVNQSNTYSKSYTDQSVAEAKDYADRGDAKLSSKIEDVKHRAYSGVAGVAAMANIPSVPGHTFDVGVGVGTFENAASVAVGAHYRPSDDNVFKVSVSKGNEGSAVFGAGYTYGF